MDYCEFNPEQQQAINLRAHRVKFIATAGCGKSAVMAYKIKHDGYHNPKTISFTNAQIDKMSKDGVKSETTHRFCIEVLNSLGLPSFGIDSISALADLFRENPALMIPLEFCDALYVDECQDSPKDFLFVCSRMMGDVYAFGDPNQSIFLFNGSIGTNWAQQDGNEWQEFYFRTCYRCTQEVINYGYLFMEQPYTIKGMAKMPTKMDDDDYMCLAYTNNEVSALRSMGLKASTVHKAKGLEWGTVYICQSRKDPWRFKGWTHYMKYVAITRAKYRIGVVYIEDGKREFLPLLTLKGLESMPPLKKEDAIAAIYRVTNNFWENRRKCALDPEYRRRRIEYEKQMKRKRAMERKLNEKEN